MELEVIVTSVLSIVTMFAGGFWLKAKGKFKHAKDVIKEALDVVIHVDQALEDDKITKEEKDAIKVEIGELKAAWKFLIGK